MKSILRRSLAALLAVMTVFTMCAVSITSVVAAVGSAVVDNKPCDCGAPTTEWEIKVSCDQWGAKGLECTNCHKEWIIEYTEPTEHTWIDDSKAATCTDKGFKGEICSKCGATGQGEETPALGHDYKTVIDSEADCNKPGKIEKECTRCGDKITEDRPAPGHEHKLVEDQYLAPTCDTKGYTTYKCENCTDTFQVIYRALGHSLNKTKIPATCYADGYNIGGKCLREGCDYVVAAKVIAKFEHKGYENYPVVAVENGMFDKDGDGKVDTLVSYDGKCDVNNPEKGWDYYECPHYDAVTNPCERYIKVEREPNHTPVEKPGSYIAPTCYSFGSRVLVCSKCGYSETEIIEKVAHQYTTTHNALTARVWTFRLTNGEYFKVNGVIYWVESSDTPAVPAGATNATPIDWVMQAKPDCGVKGIFTHACAVCNPDVDGYLEALEIDVPHLNATKKGTVQPTCTKDGYEIWQCTNPGCGSNEDGIKGRYYVYTAALKSRGHTDKDGNYLGFDKNGIAIPAKTGDLAATCLSGPRKSVDTCYTKNCDAGLYGNEAPINPNGKLDHKFTIEKTLKGATCLEPKETVIMVCELCGEYAKDERYAGNVAISLTDANIIYAGKPTTPGEFGEHQFTDLLTPYKAPTCAEPGREAVYRCVVCHRNNDQELGGGKYLPQLPEERETKTIYATCIYDGYFVDYCKNCYDYNNFNIIAYLDAVANGQDYFAGIYHKPTVTKNNNDIRNNDKHEILGATYYDPINGETFRRVDLTGTTPYLNANKDSGTINDGTCAAPGTEIFKNEGYHNSFYECKYCQDIVEFWVVKVHTPDRPDATCTEAKECTDCGIQLNAALSHDYKELTPATCTTDQVVKCTKCGDIKTVPNTKKDHDYAPATCEDPKTCKRCGATDGAALGHKWDVENGVVYAPTCLNKGYTKETCTVCGETRKVDELPALQHNIVLFDQRGATCLKYGYINYICDRDNCDLKNVAAGEMVKFEFPVSKFIPAIGHDIHTVEATCTTAKFEYCANCNPDQKVSTSVDCYYKELAPANGHKTDKGVTFYENCVSLAKVVDENGKVVCATCNKPFELEDYHSLSAMVDTATCHEKGIKFQYCTNDGCDYRLFHGVSEKLPHEFDYTKPATFHPSYHAATYLTGGMDVFLCTVCGDISTCKDAECTVLNPTEPLKGFVFTASTDNGVRAGEKIVNNGIIAYTIHINSANTALWGITVPVEFDKTALEFIGHDLGEDGVNIFGGAANTSTTEAALANKDGVVYVYGRNENEEQEVPVNTAPLTGKEELVTLYFRVKNDFRTHGLGETDIVTGNKDGKDYSYRLTEIKLGQIEIRDAAQNAIPYDKTDCKACEVWKLGDVTCDEIVFMEDDIVINSIVLAGGYDARADIDQDGKVDGFDLMAIKQIIVKNWTYEELFAKASQFSV